MAQSPNAMQEPSMDELLASIREIIEENTGPSPNRNANRQDMTSPEAASPTPNTAAAVNQTSGNPNGMPAVNAGRNAPQNEQHPNRSSEQNSNTSMETPPVRDAMNALAARIGLRHNEESEPAGVSVGAQQDSNLAPPAPAAMILKKVPAERSFQSTGDSVPSSQPRPLVQNTQNAGHVNPNNANLNSSPFNQGNPHNAGARPMSSGGGRPSNVGEQAIQPRNDVRPNPLTNQGVQQHPSGQQRPMEPLRGREVPPQRDAAQLREAAQDEGIARHQPMQSAGAMSSHDGRHLPPQPRVANAPVRGSNVGNPVQHNNLRENVNDETTTVGPRNLQAEHSLEARQAPRLNSSASSSTNEFVGNQVAQETLSSAPTHSTPMDRSMAEGMGHRRAIHDHHNIPEGNANQRGTQNAPAASNNAGSNNLPHPRSAPQKPHFLSQALRSAFLSIPAKDSAFQTASSLPQAPLRPQSVTPSGLQQPTRVELKAAEMIEAEVKREMDNLDKALEADFEKSAENLLRPYIAKWLDEHFSELFEKVLREEIKRVIQAQLR